MVAAALAVVLALAGGDLTLRVSPAGDVPERTVVTLTASLGSQPRIFSRRSIRFESRTGAARPWRRVARCAGAPCSVEVASPGPATIVYRATLRDGSGRVLRSSRLVTVTWRPFRLVRGRHNDYK